jgi:hypothetical protein
MLSPSKEKIVVGALVKKDFGLPGQLGEHILGWTPLGYRNDYAGVYQTRKAKVKGYTFFVKQRFYRPHNPNSIDQQAGRNKFREGMEAWALLTNPEKQVYNDLAKDQPIHGVNLFMRQWLES